MENLFEAIININNKDYVFNITQSTEKYGYGAPFSKIKDEIENYFFQGYNDNKYGLSKRKTFSVKFNVDSTVEIKFLQNIFKQAYDYGYTRYNQDEKKKYKIDLNISDPKLETQVNFLVDRIYNDGFNDGKNNNHKKQKIEIKEKDLIFINNIEDLLLKVYNDGYEKGEDLSRFKYKINIPKIDDQELVEKIKFDIDVAYKNGQYDFDKNKKKKYSVKLDYISDPLLKQQISSLIDSAYLDGYNFKLKEIEQGAEEARRTRFLKDKELEELSQLIKKYGEIKEKKFSSILYQYVISNDQLKVKDDYDFINIKSENINLLEKVKKIVNSSYSKGKEDAINGLEKGFFIFKVPPEIRDELVKKEFNDIVNKAYSDGYQEIINNITSELSKKINKTPDQERLEYLLRKYKKPINRITNLPDRYVKKEQYSVEVDNET